MDMPWPARDGDKMGDACRPWPGLAKAGLSGVNEWDHGGTDSPQRVSKFRA